MTPHLGPIASRLNLPPPEARPACTWTSSPAGETAAYPCTAHEDGAHVFADGHRLPLAVTDVTLPPIRPVPLDQCEDVETVLARHGLGKRTESTEG